MKKSNLRTVKLGAFCAALVLSMTAISTADTINWGQLGPDFTDHASFTGTTVGGTTFTVTDAGRFFEKRTDPNSWAGTFPLTSPVLWTANNGQIDIQFATPIASFSTLVESNFYGFYTAYMNAFDAGHNQVDATTVSGIMGNAPGTAPGFTVNGSISEVQIGLLVAPFQINDLAISSGASSPVPEPSTLALLGLGGIGCAIAAIRRRRQNATAV